MCGSRYSVEARLACEWRVLPQYALFVLQAMIAMVKDWERGYCHSTSASIHCCLARDCGAENARVMVQIIACYCGDGTVSDSDRPECN